MKIPPKRQYPPIKQCVVAAQNNKILIIFNSFPLHSAPFPYPYYSFFLSSFPSFFFFFFSLCFFSSASLLLVIRVLQLIIFPYSLSCLFLYFLFILYFYSISSFPLILYLFPPTFLVWLFLFKYSGQHSCGFSVWKGTRTHRSVM